MVLLKQSDGKPALTNAESLRETARKEFNNFQMAWFGFAKAVSEIHENESWRELGHHSFKTYCQEEYEACAYSRIIKLVKVMKHLGKQLESHIKKQPHLPLPSYETLYQFTSAECLFPEDEVDELRKDVLKGKVTVQAMREKVREVKGSDSDYPDDDEIIDVTPTSSVSSGKDASGLRPTADMLMEKMKNLTESVTKSSMGIQQLYEKLQELVEPMNSFMEGYESLTGTGE